MTENDPSAQDDQRAGVGNPPSGTPAQDTPAAGTPASSTPAANAPAHETPAYETPAYDSSAPETPSASAQDAPLRDEPHTPAHGVPTGEQVYGAHGQQPGQVNPWAAPGQSQGQNYASGYQTAQHPHTPQHGQGYPQYQSAPEPGPYPGGHPVQPGVHGSQTGVFAPPQQRKPASKGTGKLVAGVAVLALLVGGAAGGVGGYLASDGASGGSVNALDAPKPAQQTASAPAGSVEAVAAKLGPSVAQLQVTGSRGSGEGSGFVLSQDGYILTNNHVVEVAAGGGQIQAVFQDGKKGAAKVVGRDPTTDIAVVKVDGISGLTPVELGRSDDLKVGQSVVAIGSPFELAGTVTSGIVSSLHRPVTAGGQGDQNTVMDAVQTDAAINPGNSGGPLANSAGQVIGINSAIYSPQSAQGGQQGSSEGGNVGIGFAIPIDQARRTADDIINTGKAIQTYIGASVAGSDRGATGATIASVEPGSPAEKAGLKSGDVVTKFDDRVIDSSNALVAAVRTRAPNEKVTLTVGDSRKVDITLAGKPVDVN